jgi:GNAT superfamily N-acetyltransferase
MIIIDAYSATRYEAGMIGRCTSLMAPFYCEKFGLDARFEADLAAGMADLIGRFDPDFDGFWVARQISPAGNGIVGCIAVDGRARNRSNATIRWFYLSPQLRGHGIGQRLLMRALRHCEDRGYSRVDLTTHEALAAAVQLYQRNGFTCAGRVLHSHWGRLMSLVRFERSLRPAEPLPGKPSRHRPREGSAIGAVGR